MIHSIPMQGNYHRHANCKYWYNTSFFEKLAQVYKYNLIRLTTYSNHKGPGLTLVSAILQKTEQSVSASKEEFQICEEELWDRG